MKKLYLIWFLLAAMLTGCGSVPENPKPPPIQQKQIHVDSNLLRLCEPLTLYDPTKPMETYLLEHYITTIQMYGVCAQQQRKSVLVIKHLTNVKD